MNERTTEVKIVCCDQEECVDFRLTRRRTVKRATTWLAYNGLLNSADRRPGRDELGWPDLEREGTWQRTEISMCMVPPGHIPVPEDRLACLRQAYRSHPQPVLMSCNFAAATGHLSPPGLAIIHSSIEPPHVLPPSLPITLAPGRQSCQSALVISTVSGTLFPPLRECSSFASLVPASSNAPSVRIKRLTRVACRILDGWAHAG